jgi:cobalt transporter subunit CbtA
MILRVLSTALVAGFLAACVASGLQAVWTTPLILRAETFEKSASSALSERPAIVLAHHAADHADPHTGKDHDWKPADGLSRTAFTSLATLVGGVGYALVLIALMLAAGAEPTRETSLRWAAGAFLAVNLAPAIGLPPELPGMGGGHLALRQAWWAFAVIGTGVGFYLLTHVRSRAGLVAGLAAIALPHLIGAPHGAVVASEVPAALAAQFATRSLAIGFAFWATLSLALAWVWTKQAQRAALPAAA